MASAERPEWLSASVVQRGNGGDRHRPDMDLVARGQLGHDAEVLFRGQAAGARRHDEVRVPGKALERGKVEVVPVEVRDEHSVERRERGLVDRLRDADEVRDAATQHRVREQPHPR